MEKVDEKLIDIYELLGDYLEKAGYFEEEDDDEDEVKEETEENEKNKDEKDETYSEEEVQEILNRE